VFIGQRPEFADFNAGGEAADPEIARMDLEQAAGPLSDRGLVIAQVRAVGGAHFPQAGTGGFDQFGKPEARADFDELPAADDHLSGAGQDGGGQQQGGRPVVHGQRILGSGTGAQQCLTRAGPAFGARPGRQVHFDVDITCRREQSGPG
jgi:hypothetical protein